MYMQVPVQPDDLDRKQQYMSTCLHLSQPPVTARLVHNLTAG
jgi:hypothetical protein